MQIRINICTRIKERHIFQLQYDNNWFAHDNPLKSNEICHMNTFIYNSNEIFHCIV